MRLAGSLLYKTRIRPTQISTSRQATTPISLLSRMNFNSTSSSDASSAVTSHTHSKGPSSSTDPSAPAAGKNEKKIFAPSSVPGSQQAEQYTKGSLDLSDLDADPLTQFDRWFKAAGQAGVYQPETVNLSTASLPEGKVSSRFVYLKELDATGFVVYSNFGTSRKAADLATNAHASLAFWWREVERQVRVEGRAERLSGEESQPYFDTRERGSRIGAHASRQSQVIRDRGELEGWVREEEERWEGKERITVPDNWGGLRIVPEVVEFWQGRRSRLHDRFRYTKGKEGEWRVERLSP
ncbi:pyridoxamine 5'-phosphate oxidase [Myriangium duriaei CBS 260.36]|uniref:pyridoxal 5'-phosphate synthase n=1 Tax=Myriangium duriaei CBS 260.36 TaxID=1168546 RepID=A0A9P4ITM7_9PEZI|nr:pyridoxamine 5'-phosphate oxidase [Myriangium duriaei CBS 260.36]